MEHPQSAEGAAVDANPHCWILTTIDGHVLKAGGDLRAVLNMSERGLRRRDWFAFIGKDRTVVRHLATITAPDVAVERTLVVRPRDRRPLLVRATFTRQTDDATVLWTLSKPS
jgi:hypothetical protein